MLSTIATFSLLASVPVPDLFTCASTKTMYQGAGCCDTSTPTSGSEVAVNTVPGFYTFPLPDWFLDTQPVFSGKHAYCTVTFGPRTLTTRPYYPDDNGNAFGTPVMVPTTRTLTSVSGNVYTYVNTGPLWAIEFHSSHHVPGDSTITNFRFQNGTNIPSVMGNLSNLTTTVTWTGDRFQWAETAFAASINDYNRLNGGGFQGLDNSTLLMTKYWAGKEYYAKKGFSRNRTLYA